MVDFILEHAYEFADRIEYSVLHMNYTQWGIFAFVCLTIAVLAVRTSGIT